MNSTKGKNRKRDKNVNAEWASKKAISRSVQVGVGKAIVGEKAWGVTSETSLAGP